MEYLYSIICLLLVGWRLPHIGFIKRSGLTAGETRLLFALKLLTSVMAAVYFQYVFRHISLNIDYIGYNEKGLLQYQLLISDPKTFFTDFSNDVNQYGFGGLLASKDSFWAYLRFNVLFKLIAVLNLVTKGNFLLNTALFSAIVFFGHIAFFRIYYSIYKKNKWRILAACFCIPSLLLYISCIHKDGIIFFSLAMISYVFYRLLTGASILNWTYLLTGFLSLASIFIFRNYVVIALVPAMLISKAGTIPGIKKRFLFPGIYIVLVLLFFATGLMDAFNLPAAVVERKADFASLDAGNTNIAMNRLQPTMLSFAKNIPQAINHVFFRPYLWEFSQMSVLLTAVELFFYQLLVVSWLIFRKRNNGPLHPFNIFGLLLLLHMMLIIGYTIPNIGAIVRYRSIFWIFLIAPLLCNFGKKVHGS